MSTQTNDRLDEIAADKIRRQEAIANLTQESKRQARMALLTFVTFIGFFIGLIVVAIIFGKPSIVTSALPVIVVVPLVVQIVLRIQFDSKIALRTAIDQLANRLDRLEARLINAERRGNDEETT